MSKLNVVRKIGRKVSKQSLSYKDAGVDINAGNQLVERIKPDVKNQSS